MIDWRGELLRLWQAVRFCVEVILAIAICFVEVLLLPFGWVRKPMRKRQGCHNLPFGVYWDTIRPYLELVRVDPATEVLTADYDDTLVPDQYRYATPPAWGWLDPRGADQFERLLEG